MAHSDNNVETPTHVVGIGASAGGLKAIEAFFEAMPTDTSLAFVLVQHLSPDHKSMMQEILSKRTPLQVIRAEQGMKVAANCVYLIPPRKNLTIFHNELVLSEQDHNHGLNLPIDVFLRSLADDLGPKAIAIILSGTGSDGMRGIRAVKETGGLVLVQDEESADFDGMPRAAISTGLADFILPPEEMPQQLLAYLNHPLAVSDGTSGILLSDEDNLTRIFSILRDKTKVDFTFYKPSTVVRRIERRMTVNQVNDLGEYTAFLERSPHEVNTLHRELLIGVTNFFRDSGAWEYLETKVLPELFANCNDDLLRVWVPGCSTGEEAYSLAIMLEEYRVNNNHENMKIKVFATDIDRDSILFASNGIYPESIAADIDGPLLAKYFMARGETFQVSRQIRESIVFAQHNLIRDPPFTRISFVSCRNLLIYLQQVLQTKVISLFNFSLLAGGILFLGTSETTGECSDLFEALHHKWKVFRSKGIKRLPRDPNESIISTPQDLRGRFVRLREGVIRDLRPYQEERMLDRFLQGMTQRDFPLTLLVNESEELLYVVGNAEGYLRLPSGKQQSLVTRLVVEELSIPISTALQKVQSGAGEVSVTNISLQGPKFRKSVSMHVSLLPQRRGQAPLFAIQFTELDKKSNEEVQDTVVTYDLDVQARQRINDLEQELQFVKENLQATIEELETSNEELQATNEELLSSNEELQSTNEELQSVNEELYTVNAELQSKIVELTELNNDMDNLLRATSIPTLFIDENFEVRKFTPDATAVFNILEQDVCRPLNHITHRVIDEDLHGIVRGVLDTEKAITKEVTTEDGGWFLMRVLPYRIGRGLSSGIVMTFVDISQQKQSQFALSEGEGRLRALARLTSTGYWEYDLEKDSSYWTDEVYDIYGITVSEPLDMTERLKFYTENTRPHIRAANEKLLNEGIAYDLSAEIITPKGDKRLIRSIGKPETVDGKVVKVWGAIQDVTELRQAISSRKETEAKYRGLFESMASGVAVYEAVDNGKDFIFVDFNRAAEKIESIEKSELVGRRLTEVFPGAKDFGLIDLLHRVWQTGHPEQMPANRYEDERIQGWRKNFAFRLDTGQLVVIYEDVTEDMHRELLIKETMEATKDGIWDWNVVSGDVYYSPAWTEMLGESQVSADYETWAARIHPDDKERVLQSLQEHMEGKTDYWREEHRLKIADGTYKVVLGRGRVVSRASNGSPLRMIGAMTDLSHRKEEK